MKYKVGQIVFFDFKKGIIAKCINFYHILNHGFSRCSHVGIITKVDDFEVTISEALSNGFTESIYKKAYLYENTQLKNMYIKETKIKLNDVYSNSQKYLGKPYGFLDIFSIILSFITRFKNIKLTGSKSLICSEAVARILYDSSNKKINFEKEYSKPYDLITPMDIYLSKFIKFI